MQILLRCLFFAPIFFTSCSDDRVIITGDRLSVFEYFDLVEVNKNAYNEGSLLGEVYKNLSFTHPGVNNKHEGGHLKGPVSDLKKLWSVDIGKGTNKNVPSMSNLTISNDK